MSSRVVMLTRRDELARQAGDGLDLIPVKTGYEAAAELLADPPAALVVELAQLTGPHTRLLDVARKRGVPALGVGTFPPGLSADDLEGLNLVSTRQLPAILAELAGRDDARDEGDYVSEADQDQPADAKEASH